MTKKEALPKLFNEYWKMTNKLPSTQPAEQNIENLSKEWNEFLLAVKKRVEEDFKLK